MLSSAGAIRQPVGFRGLYTFALTLISFLFVNVVYAADVTVSATVDRNALNPDDTLTLTVSIESGGTVDVQTPRLPSLEDFEILNEWTSHSQQASMIATPGGPQFKRVTIVNYHYLLMPKRQGDLRIGAVEVVVDGKVHLTKPIQIKVAPGAGVSSPGQGQQQRGGGGAFPPGFFDDDEDDLFSQLLRRVQPPSGGVRTLPMNPNEAFFIQVEADKTEAYVGEQITVSYYLYTRGLIRDLDTLKYPSLKGFWKEDIEIATHLNFQNEVVNGIPYKKALLASYALFPIKEGTATIDSYRVRCSVISPDALGLGFGRAYSFTKASEPVKVKVKPIPVEGRPSDFSGAVGEFQVSARIEDRVITENQPLTLKIRFEGRGNAKLIDLPAIDYPEGLELYDHQDEAKFFRTGTSYKEFRILLIPRRPGEFTIPSISVSVFDPVQGQFIRKATEPITFTARKGVGGGVASQGLPEDQAAKNESRGPVKPKLITSIDAYRAPSPFVQWSAWGAVYGLILVGLLWRARTRLGWGQRKKDILRILKSRLAKVEALGAKGDWRGVGTEMTNTLYYVLGSISGEGGANMELEKLLQKAPPSVRRELGEPLKKQMEFFQMLTFAPDAVVEDLKKSTRLKTVISEMEDLLIKAVSLGLSDERSNGRG